VNGDTTFARLRRALFSLSMAGGGIAMEAPVPEKVEVRKTGQHTLDMVTSVCALVISAISIFMAWDNGNDMQKLVHANSWPALQLASGNSRDDRTQELYFSVSNAGIGPARVHSFGFWVGGVPVKGEWSIENVARACCEELFNAAVARFGGDVSRALGNYPSQPVGRTFLSPGQHEIVVSWPRIPDNEKIWDAVDHARWTADRRITTRACYCSVFDECWIADSDKFPPHSVPSCGDSSQKGP
jgi:hypothetical protein